MAGYGHAFEEGGSSSGAPKKTVPVRRAVDSVPVKASIPTELLVTEGAKRIAIELEGNSDATDYIRTWNDLVLSSSLAVSQKLTAGLISEKKFFELVWDHITNKRKISYNKNDGAFLSECLDTNKFDCDTSSMLVYDIGKNIQEKSGISLKLVSTPNHILVTSGNYFFETTSGAVLTKKEFERKYPVYTILEEYQIPAITYCNRGAFYRNKGTKNPVFYDKALADFREATTLNTRYYGALIGLGRVYRIKKMYDEAIRAYDRVIMINPSDADPHNNKGTVYLDKMDYPRAITELTTAIQLNPKFAEAYTNLGRAYLLMSPPNIPLALKNCSKAVDLKKDGIFYTFLGDVYLLMGKEAEKKNDTSEAQKNYAQAKKNYERAVYLDITDASAHYGIGNCYKKDATDKTNRKYEKAVEEYTLAILYNADFTDAYFNRANTYYLFLKNPVKALEDYTSILTKNPKHIGARTNRANVYDALGKTDLAKADRLELKKL